MPLVVSCLFLCPSGLAADTVTPDFRPDPDSVQRYGPAYRYPQAGWIVLHIEGEPYERGYQHGRLLAPELAAYVRCFAALVSPKAPVEGWRSTRLLVNSLFLRRYEKEYLEEMKGIADGASAAGARFDNRPIDLVDVVGVNALYEVETLDSALDATPTGLEGIRFPHPQPRAMPAPKPMHCSAFAATGPATADGKIVFGHITMSSLYPSLYSNVWLDVKPSKGHRVLIQTYPGGIQSGFDYYMNDAGLLVTETTLAQTKFDINGLALASRIRQALQYADGIEQACEILKNGNNGLYTNEWLLADINTNEIAMFELGTHKSKLYRSSRGDWVAGTQGFYWGCNNTKDLEVNLETIPGTAGRPHSVVFCPSDRDKLWLRLFNKYKGKIDVAFAKEAFTTPPLAAYHSADAKFTTTDLAHQLKTWALIGPPLGKTWQPTQEERQRYPEIRPFVHNPWTVLHTRPPTKEKTGDTVVDLPDRIEEMKKEDRERDIDEERLVREPAWNGTLLPKTDADIWLATAFANYEGIASLEQACKERNQTAGEKPLLPADRDRLAVRLNSYRSRYLAGARAGQDTPLDKTHSNYLESPWYHVAAGKGVWVLHELRQLLGNEKFHEIMETFGRDHAGRAVATAEFQAHAEKVAGKKLGQFFDRWMKEPGLPAMRLAAVKTAKSAKGYRVEGLVHRDGRGCAQPVEVVVETAKGEKAQKVIIDSDRATFAIETPESPRRVIVDKYCMTAKSNGGAFTTGSFAENLENTLIVYGTGDEVPSNREAAEGLQRAIIETWSNYTVPIKSDKEVTEEDLKSHHLLLTGRPDSNSLIERFRENLPVKFGSRSFTVRSETYAHPNSAVILAADNPLNRRYSLVIVAGLSAESTVQAATQVFFRDQQVPSEVTVIANRAKPRHLVVPARELVVELGEPGIRAKNGTTAARSDEHSPVGASRRTGSER
jgi:hypothetical protein